MIEVGQLVTGAQAEELPTGSAIVAQWMSGGLYEGDGGSALVKVTDDDPDGDWVSHWPGVPVSILHNERMIKYRVLYVGSGVRE